MKVPADGDGVVSHAGAGLLRGVAELTGLSAQVTGVLADTYRGAWTHAPGAVFADLADAVADGANCVNGVAQLWGIASTCSGRWPSTATLRRLCDERNLLPDGHLLGLDVDPIRLLRIEAGLCALRFDPELLTCAAAISPACPVAIARQRGNG